jgi:hypothetical protein
VRGETATFSGDDRCELACFAKDEIGLEVLDGLLERREHRFYIQAGEDDAHDDDVPLSRRP